MYKKVELTEGTMVQYVGVHAVNWRQGWGQPSVGFVEVDEDEYDLTDRIHVECPSCGHDYKYTPDHGALTSTCPNCHKTFDLY